MNTNSVTLATEDPTLPTPHHCPWFVQYLLASPLRRLVEPAKPLLGPHIEPGMTVVEPGCGFGYISLNLARMVGPSGRVISVDIEPRAVARLERKARRKKLVDRMELRACESRDLGLSEFAGQVDRVVVVHTLHEFEDLPGTLAQFKALLKPTGQVVVVEPKGHVTRLQFDAMMVSCRQAGFVERDTPDVGKKRMAAVLQVA